MVTKTAVLLVTVVVGGWSSSIPSRAIIVPQPNSPVSITAYKAGYTPGVSGYSREGIHHGLQYTNRSDKQIVAIRFGLVSFDAFNQHIGTTGGIELDDLQPAQQAKGDWVQSAYSDFAFLTGIAYVSKVRFADDQIWIADMSVVLSELRKIQSDFDAKELEEKRQPNPQQ